MTTLSRYNNVGAKYNVSTIAFDVAYKRQVPYWDAWMRFVAQATRDTRATGVRHKHAVTSAAGHFFAM